MGIRSTALGLALGVALCAPAFAQETKQTVEGAQKFLELMMKGTSVNIPIWTYSANHAAPINRFGTARAVQTIGRCHSRAQLAFDRYETRLTNPYSKRPQDYSWDAATREWDMRFDRWTGVEVRDKTKIHVHSTDGKVVVLKASSETLVARLAHALDFLRQNCDAAANTGF